MNKTKLVTTRNIGFLLCIALLGALTGCVGYVHGPRHERVYVPPPAVAVEASLSSGFAPKAIYDAHPHGRWRSSAPTDVADSRRVDSDWRPTATAIAHRRRLALAKEVGLGHVSLWSPGFQRNYWYLRDAMAPAWVSWHSGGGYRLGTSVPVREVRPR